MYFLLVFLFVIYMARDEIFGFNNTYLDVWSVSNDNILCIYLFFSHDNKTNKKNKM